MEFTMCQNVPGMCAGDPACKDHACPGHPCNRMPADAFDVDWSSGIVMQHLHRVPPESFNAAEPMQWDEEPIDWRPVVYVAICVGLTVAAAIARAYLA